MYEAAVGRSLRPYIRSFGDNFGWKDEGDSFDYLCIDVNATLLAAIRGDHDVAEVEGGTFWKGDRSLAKRISFVHPMLKGPT